MFGANTCQLICVFRYLIWAFVVRIYCGALDART